MGYQDHVSVVYFNVCSLLPKIDNLRLICASLYPSFVCVAETWLSSETDDSEICIQGYTSIRLDHSRHGSGLVIYVHNLFSFSVLFKESPDFEFLVISCKSSINSPDFHLAFLYRPPSSNASLLDILFSTFCTFNPSVFTNFCIIGDFNANYLLPSTSSSNKLSCIMSPFSLSQIVSEPT